MKRRLIPALATLVLCASCVTHSKMEASALQRKATFGAAVDKSDWHVLYATPDANGKPYRIPAIATAPNGHIFGIADNRPCGNDIGYGEVDIKCRISTDHGATWGDEFFVADGRGATSMRWLPASVMLPL